MDFGENFADDPEDTNEIQDTLDSLKCKNRELNESITFLKTENLQYKKKYHDLKQQLTKLNELLERNAQVFHQLFDDTRSALQMGRIPTLNSPVLQKNVSPVKTKNVPGPSRVAATVIGLGTRQSSRNVVRRKIPIEPVQMSELQPTEIEEDPTSHNALFRDGLSTILEESFHAASKGKELSVMLNRLPPDLLAKHVHEQNEDVLADNSTLSFTDSSALDSESEFSSTPVKLESMRRLGLAPTNKAFINAAFSNFICTRRRENNKRDNLIAPQDRSVSPKKEKVVSPKRERLSPKRESNPCGSRKRVKSSPRDQQFVSKRKKIIPEVVSQNLRPVRSAKPKSLREESLRVKKRRS